MHDPHMAREGVVAAECPLLAAVLTADFVLLAVVDGVFVPRQVVGSAENSIARLPGSRIGAVTLVRARLAVSGQYLARCHSTANRLWRC